MSGTKGGAAKNVYCFMDIKIGPRFAGRIVFEVRGCGGLGQATLQTWLA